MDIYAYTLGLLQFWQILGIQFMEFLLGIQFHEKKEEESPWHAAVYHNRLKYIDSPQSCNLPVMMNAIKRQHAEWQLVQTLFYFVMIQIHSKDVPT